MSTFGSTFREIAIKSIAVDLRQCIRNVTEGKCFERICL